MALKFGISLSFQIHPDWARAGHLGREKKQLIRLVDDALRTGETSSETAAGFSGRRGNRRHRGPTDPVACIREPNRLALSAGAAPARGLSPTRLASGSFEPS
jgi:hypothetical protein